MHGKGSRHLEMRLAVGAAPRQRVEVVSIRGVDVPVQLGERGTILEIDDVAARVLFDSGAELAVDPHVVRLRPLLRPA
jgi:hypothetical protein